MMIHNADPSTSSGEMWSLSDDQTCMEGDGQKIAYLFHILLTLKGYVTETAPAAFSAVRWKQFHEERTRGKLSKIVKDSIFTIKIFAKLDFIYYILANQGYARAITLIDNKKLVNKRTDWWSQCKVFAPVTTFKTKEFVYRTFTLPVSLIENPRFYNMTRKDKIMVVYGIVESTLKSMLSCQERERLFRAGTLLRTIVPKKPYEESLLAAIHSSVQLRKIEEPLPEAEISRTNVEDVEDLLD